MKKILLLCLSLFFLTSCWDLKEIEEIGFVLAVAIDPLDKEEEEQYKEQYKKEAKERALQMFKTTYQVVVPSALVEGGASGGQLPFFNISTVGQTNFKMNRHISSRRSRRLNYEHLKVVIINSELVKNGELGKFIDFYIRDHEMRTKTLVLVSEGKGSEVLKEKLPLELMPAISINMIQENYLVHHGIPIKKTIGELATCVLDEKSYLVPRVKPEQGKDFVLSGAAVFMGEENKFIGWLGEVDSQGYSLVIGDGYNMVIEATYEDQLFVFEIDNEDTVIKYQRIDGKDHFKVMIKAEGFFVENWIENLNLNEADTSEKLEKALEEEIKKLASEIIFKMQKQFYADIFEMYKQVELKDNSYWKKVKNNWDGEDGHFRNAIVDVDAKVQIRHYMTKEQLT